MKQYVKPEFEVKSLMQEEKISADGFGNEVPVVSFPGNWVANDD